MGFNFDSVESYVSEHLKLFISLILGTIVLVGLAAVAVFFIAVRGSEQTMIPDVQGKELTGYMWRTKLKIY